MLNDQTIKFLRDIRAGRITSSTAAAERYATSTATVWRRVSQLRAAGYEIATTSGPGKAWQIIREPRT